MTDQHQQNTPTTLTDAAARCRAAIEQYASSTPHRSLREHAAAASVLPIRRPRQTILAVGFVFVAGSLLVGTATGEILEGFRTAVGFGIGVVVVLVGMSSPRATHPADHRSGLDVSGGRTDESAENRTYSTPTTEEVPHHD